jgi:hypothetical protein
MYQRWLGFGNERLASWAVVLRQLAGTEEIIRIVFALERRQTHVVDAVSSLNPSSPSSLRLFA